jgi:hypothetical protein
VQEITVDGDVVFSAAPQVPPNGFDLSQFSFAYSIPTRNGKNAYEVQFNDDGTKYYEGEVGNVSQFSLSTPYDLQSRSHDADISLDSTSENGFTFNDDGTRFYEVDRGTNQIRQFTLSTAYDLTTLPNTPDKTESSPDGFTQAITWKPDGTKFYTAENSGASGTRIRQLSVSTPYDIANYSIEDTATITDQMREVNFSLDGSLMHAVNVFEEVKQFTLATPFEIGTRTLDFTLDTSPQTTGNIIGAQFNNIGTIYAQGSFDENVYVYEL